MNHVPLNPKPGVGAPIRRVGSGGFLMFSWLRRLAEAAAAKEQSRDRVQNLNQASAKPIKIVLRRKRKEDPTARYDELARLRVMDLACRRGGPALEIGTGPCACMGQRLARCGMSVTGVDCDANAVAAAQRAAAAAGVYGRFKVQQADAGRLPFDNGSYRVVLAFDCLGHARNPKRILAEIFRVRAPDGVVLITEYNEPGRRATRHRNFGFEERLGSLLQAHCADCRRIEQPHHLTYVCEANANP